MASRPREPVPAPAPRSGAGRTNRTGAATIRSPYNDHLRGLGGGDKASEQIFILRYGSLNRPK